MWLRRIGLVGIVWSAGCGDGRVVGGLDASAIDATPEAADLPDAAETVSFKDHVHPLIAASCTEANCHDMGRTMNHWSDFTTPASTHQRWVNNVGFDFCVDVPSNGIYTQRVIVVPGDPDASYLMMKLRPPTTASCQDPTHHRQMPPEPRSPLPPQSIETIATWIREGARQN
jgi:hypothetical protein